MVIVVCEASEAGQAAVVSLPLPLLLLPFLLPSPDLVVQLGLSVQFLCSLSVTQKRERITKTARRRDDISSYVLVCQ